ncbi:DUF488 domain-containing protein [Niabella terrae]
MATSLQIKRIYAPAAATDGYRILVDRLWPRGISKDHAAVDLWLKEIAPSTALRKWFGHDPEKWREFQQKYLAELKNNPAAATLLEAVKVHRHCSLLYGAKDEAHNQAVVLRGWLDKALK